MNIDLSEIVKRNKDMFTTNSEIILIVNMYTHLPPSIPDSPFHVEMHVTLHMRDPTDFDYGGIKTKRLEFIVSEAKSGGSLFNESVWYAKHAQNLCGIVESSPLSVFSLTVDDKGASVNNINDLELPFIDFIKRRKVEGYFRVIILVYAFC